MSGQVVDLRPCAAGRVTRSHLVEFQAPGVCGTADAMRCAAAWLDENPDPSPLAVYLDYDADGDTTFVVLVVQAVHDADLESQARG